MIDIRDYQENLTTIENINEVFIEKISLKDFIKGHNTEISFGSTPFLKGVTKLTRFDLYYTALYNKDEQSDLKLLKRSYDYMESYDYPFNKVSFNSDVRPLVPHIKDLEGKIRFGGRVARAGSSNDMEVMAYFDYCPESFKIINY